MESCFRHKLLEDEVQAWGGRNFRLVVGVFLLVDQGGGVLVGVRGFATIVFGVLCLSGWGSYCGLVGSVVSWRWVFWPMAALWQGHPPSSCRSPVPV